MRQPARRRANLFLCAAALAAAWWLSPFKLGIAVGHSMTPTIPDRGLYVLDTRYYQAHPVRRGDIAVFDRGGITYVKRVFAVAGDHVWLVRQRSDPDAEIVSPAVVRRLRRLLAHLSTRCVWRLDECVVPAGQCFFLGDNTQASQDSRTYGPVAVDAIRGRVIRAPALADLATRLAGNPEPPGGI